MSKKHGIDATYTNYRKMIADGGLDAIVVASPDDQHLQMTLAAIEKGLHVLCEKPLANTAADARVMLEAAERAGVRHMVLFTWRWQPHFQFLSRWSAMAPSAPSIVRSFPSLPASRATTTTPGVTTPSERMV
jgi:predicted dehydrogenase